MAKAQDISGEITENKNESGNPKESRKPILELSPAEIAYFEQTRRECDTEKAQKDKALQYAFLVAGGSNVYGLTKLTTISMEESWTSLLISFSLLIIVIGLMNWRRQKLRAQGYRWVVLYGLIKSGIRKNAEWVFLEEVICKGVKKNIHGRDDLWFLVGLTLPIVTLILWHSYKLVVVHCHYIALIFGLLSVVFFVWSIFRHSRPSAKEFGIGNLLSQIEKQEL